MRKTCKLRRAAQPDGSLCPPVSLHQNATNAED